MKKFNLKSTKFINFIFLLILVLLFIFIYYFSPTITNIIENSKNNNVKSENESNLLSYKIYDNTNSDNLKILLKINSNNGIEYIKEKDGTTIYGNSKNKIALDYTCSINNEETIVVKEIGNKEKTEKFTISEIGSADFPFIINTADELINIQNTDYNLLNIDSKTVFYRLGKDIDLSTIENWTPIGTEKNPFVGTLDGDGHTISNLNFNNTSESNFGLFGYSSATLKNIKLENFNITGKDTIGALVGNLKGTIDNIEANNIIISGAENNIGGLVGTCTSLSSISNCTVNATVHGTNNVGGICGYVNYYNCYTDLHISNNYANVELSGTTNVGGILGYLYVYDSIYIRDDYIVQNLYIENNYTTGNSICSGNNIGGIVGKIDEFGIDPAYCNAYGSHHYFYIHINNSYSEIKLTSQGNNIGGILGYGYVYANGRTDYQYKRYDLIIENSFTTSDITGNDYVGTIAGYLYKYSRESGSDTFITLKNLYGTGKITSTDTNIGLLGKAIQDGYTAITISATNCYYVPETTGLSTTSTYGTAKNYQNMFTQSEFSSWDFNTIWVIEEGSTMPYLRNIPKPNKINKSQ